MKEKEPIVHPYIPNSVPAVKERMLEEVGAESVDEFYEDVPDELRLREDMNLPEPFLSEYGLRRHVEGILQRIRRVRNTLTSWEPDAGNTTSRPYAMR